MTVVPRQFEGLSASAHAALLRAARRIKEGFVGEIVFAVKPGGGVGYIRWVNTETGESFKKEELGE